MGEITNIRSKLARTQVFPFEIAEWEEFLISLSISVQATNEARMRSARPSNLESRFKLNDRIDANIAIVGKMIRSEKRLFETSVILEPT